MPIEPVKIPQNVQIEDRLIGPITLRQVIICLIGGGASFVIWNVFQKSGTTGMFAAAISLVPLIVAAAFAFVQVQGLSLLRIILLIVEKSKKPAKRALGPRAGISINVKTYFLAQGENKTRSSLTAETNKLSQLSSLLDEEASANKPETAGSLTNDKTFETETQPEGIRSPVDKGKINIDSPAERNNVDGISHTEAGIHTSHEETVRDISTAPST